MQESDSLFFYGLWTMDYGQSVWDQLQCFATGSKATGFVKESQSGWIDQFRWTGEVL